MENQNRARINPRPEDWEKAMMLTGKVRPVEVFTELVRIAEDARTAEEKRFDHPEENESNPGKVLRARNPEQYDFNESQKSEKQYWETRFAKARTIEKELHLMKEISKMDKTEIELVIEAPKKLPEWTQPPCWKCKKTGHWANDCPNVNW